MSNPPSHPSADALEAAKERLERYANGERSWNVWPSNALFHRREDLRTLLSALGSEGEDSRRMNWLERQHVEVRTPTRFGSWPAFSAHVSTSDEEGEWFDVPSDLRAKIDAALSTPGDA